jgi:hypothetical protein
MPWTHLREWRYISTILDLGTEGEWSASRLCRFTPGGNISPHLTHWTGVWVGFRVGLNATGKRKILHCREMNLGHPASSPLLYRLSYPDSFPYTSPLKLYTVFRISWTCATCSANHILSDKYKVQAPGCSVRSSFHHYCHFLFLRSKYSPSPSLADGQEKKLVRSSNMLYITLSPFHVRMTEEKIAMDLEWSGHCLMGMLYSARIARIPVEIRT